MGGSWAIGITLAILGSVASNLGVNTQKYSFKRNAMRAVPLTRSHWKDPFWLLGMCLVVFGSLGDFAALSMVAQSIVAPIGSVTLVANVIFAHYWLDEVLTWKEFAGTALIICGSSLAVAFGDHKEKQYTVGDLWELFGGALFLFYIIIVVVGCIAFYIAHKKMTPVKQRLVDAIKRYENAISKGDQNTADWEDDVILNIEHEYRPYIKYHPFCLCALSGIFGGQSVMFGKMFAELFSTSINGNNQFWNVLPWFIIIGMLSTVYTQVHFLAVGLSFFDSLYVVPVFQCFFISSVN